MDLRHYDDPFPYITVDNLLSEERISEINRLAHIELETYNSGTKLTAMGKYCRYLTSDIFPEANFLLDMLPHRPTNGNIKKIIHWCICPAGEWSSSSGRPHLDPIARIHTNTLYVHPNKSYGTMLCKNNAPSYMPAGDESQLTDNPSEYEIEIPWRPNRLFSINCMDGMWHYFKSSDQPRITLQSFVVDIDKLVNKQEPWPDINEDNFLDYVRTTVC